MSWSVGYDSNWDRDIGYGVPSICDFPKCNEKIDRGLSYVCGSEPYGGDHGCGLFFCSKHLYFHKFKDGCFKSVCSRCHYGSASSHKPKPDTGEWLRHKLTDPSWLEWRKRNKIKVTAVKG